MWLRPVNCNQRTQLIWYAEGCSNMATPGPGVRIVQARSAPWISSSVRFGLLRDRPLRLHVDSTAFASFLKGKRTEYRVRSNNTLRNLKLTSYRFVAIIFGYGAHADQVSILFYLNTVSYLKRPVFTCGRHFRPGDLCFQLGDVVEWKNIYGFLKCKNNRDGVSLGDIGMFALKCRNQ